MSLISAFISRPPISPTISGYSLDGSDTSSGGHFILPGLSYNQFLNSSDLTKAVANYNANYAGKPTPAALAKIPGDATQVFPQAVVPSHYNLGNDFTSQDIRLSKAFRYRERYELRIIAEAFNIFNFGNLYTYSDSFALNSAAFGAPQQRLSNGSTFGTGGPRAFQFAGRFTF
jgi:hypothetical protein